MLIHETPEVYQISKSFEQNGLSRQNVIAIPQQDHLMFVEPNFSNKSPDYSLISFISGISEQAEYYLTGTELRQIFICHKLGLYDNICLMLNSAVNTKLKETVYKKEASMKNRSLENNRTLNEPEGKLKKPFLQDEILHELSQLNIDMQKKVLDFTRSLITSSPKGVAGKELLEFAGIITPEEGKELLKIIDEDCGVIDYSEW